MHLYRIKDEVKWMGGVKQYDRRPLHINRSFPTKLLPWGNEGYQTNLYGSLTLDGYPQGWDNAKDYVSRA